MVVGGLVGGGRERKNSRDAEGAEFSRREKAAELNLRFDDAENAVVTEGYEDRVNPKG